MNIVILDNFDSFTFNLVQSLGVIIGHKPVVFRNNAISVGDLAALAPDAIVLSPGPGTPTNVKDFGIGCEVITRLGPSVPILGVCLGHQGIVAALGGTIIPAPRIMHGKTSAIFHDRYGLFANLPSPFRAMRYHSLVACRTSLPAEFRVCAETEDGTVMSVQHASFPLFGVQFHPESIGTDHGAVILQNFVALARTANSRQL